MARPLLCYLILTVSLLARLHQSKPQHISSYDKAKRRCYEQTCSQIPRDLAHSCILMCVDRECFYKEFMERPSDIGVGEKMLDKLTIFDNCARLNLKLKSQ